MLAALDLARRIEAGELTPMQVLDRAAEAIAKREAEVRAFVTLDLDAARKVAPALKNTPLRGLPVGLKDIFDTADLPTEYGSPIYKGHRPAGDAALVTMIRCNGGVAVGKTVTTEFAHLHPGRTRNPHNPAHTPGGSSSGSAAGIAAGFFAIATGSQTGGSVIRPASFCGVAGFKPSSGLLPTVGMKCVSWILDTAGLFAASVADVAFAAAAVSGRDLRVDRKAPAAPHIGILRSPPWPAATAEMNGAIEIAARAAAKAGARVSDVTLPPSLGEAFKAHGTIQSYEAALSLGSEYERHRDKLSKSMVELVKSGRACTPEMYDDARRTTNRARGALHELMSGIDVMLSPSAAGAAPHGLGSTGSSTFNRLWTLMGPPCVNIPGLSDPSGLPLGVQVIGRFGHDRAALEAAFFVEAAFAQ